MTIDLTDHAIPRLVVTGHPNHELAIFGFVQRMRPNLVFLTDGGGEERIDDSRRALAAIGALDRVKLLGWSEKALYDALLATDTDVLARLVVDVRRELIAFAPRQVICEAVELYNPLHDITLPVVRAAAAGLDIEIVEFPLIAQEPAGEVAEGSSACALKRHRVQRFVDGRDAATFRLHPSELATKLHARDHHYLTLRRAMSGVLDGVSDETAEIECFARASDALPTPGLHHVLRYEWRGRLLRARGEVDRVITFRDHFLAAVRSLDEISTAMIDPKPPGPPSPSDRVGLLPR